MRARIKTIIFNLLLAGCLAAIPSVAQGQTAAKAAPKAKSTSAKATAAKASPVPSTKEPVKYMGSRSAPITMEVYSDFQCPACRELYFGSIKPLRDDYINTGKVFFVHRDNPLPGHAFSRDAARYANAAAQIGKFERVAEAIYEAQQVWSFNRGKLDQVVASALTPGEFNQVRTSFNSPTVESAIEMDLGRGKTIPVTSTPTIVLIHKGRRIPLPGGVNYQLLRQVLDQLLSQR